MAYPNSGFTRPIRHVEWNLNYVWNVGLLLWEPMTQPGGGGGAGMTDAEFSAHLPLTITGPLTRAELDSDAVLVLVQGGATAAKQDTLLAELELKANLSETQPVSLASQPLPTGASTAALQTQPGVDIGDVTINNASGASAVNIQDGGNVITVDGTITANAGTGTMAVSLASVPSHAVTNAGTFAVQPTTLPTAGGKTLTFVPVNQGSAGTTQLAAASGSNKHKVMGCILTMSAAGTLKFVDSSGDLTGAMDIATAGGFVLPTSMLQYTETGAINRSISIVTTVGLAKGVVVLLTEP